MKPLVVKRTTDGVLLSRPISLYHYYCMRRGEAPPPSRHVEITLPCFPDDPFFFAECGLRLQAVLLLETNDDYYFLSVR